MLLKPALVQRTASQPQGWNDFTHGEWVCKQERTALAPYWGTVAGNYAVQLGPLSEGVSKGCKATERISVHAGPNARVKAEPGALPFAHRSIDVVVMAHVLEYIEDPHQVLREADHSLAFDGYLILTAYNPFALATLVGMLPGNRSKAPWNGRYLTKARLEDWLTLLNYEILASGYTGNSSLWPRSKLRSGDRDNPLCRFMPILGCSYYIIARKRIFPLTPSPGFVRFKQSVSLQQTAQARSSRNVR